MTARNGLPSGCWNPGLTRSKWRSRGSAASASREIDTVVRRTQSDADAARDVLDVLMKETATSSQSALDQILDGSSRLTRRVETCAVEAEERISAIEHVVTKRR